MFIKKRQYKMLYDRIEALENLASDIENALPAFRENIDEKLCGFSTDIEELQGRVKTIEEESESIQKDRETEKSFFDGLSNIMNYGVTNGQKQP